MPQDSDQHILPYFANFVHFYFFVKMTSCQQAR
jgi:hypothetical protein